MGFLGLLLGPRRKVSKWIPRSAHPPLTWTSDGNGGWGRHHSSIWSASLFGGPCLDLKPEWPKISNNKCQSLYFVISKTFIVNSGTLTRSSSSSSPCLPLVAFSCWQSSHVRRHESGQWETAAWVARPEIPTSAVPKEMPQMHLYLKQCPNAPPASASNLKPTRPCDTALSIKLILCLFLVRKKEKPPAHSPFVCAFQSLCPFSENLPGVNRNFRVGCRAPPERVSPTGGRALVLRCSPKAQELRASLKAEVPPQVTDVGTRMTPHVTFWSSTRKNGAMVLKCTYLVLAQKFNFLLCQNSNILFFFLFSWFFIIRRASGLRLIIQVDDFLINVFHYFPDLEHVTSRESVSVRSKGRLCHQESLDVIS